MRCLFCNVRLAPSEHDDMICDQCCDHLPLNDIEDIEMAEREAAEEKAWEHAEMRRRAARDRQVARAAARQTARCQPKRPGIIAVVPAAPVLRKSVRQERGLI